MPKLTIIIPTYNSAQIIRSCLDSIVQQTFTDKEVLIVDGISTDHTIDVVKEYTSQFHFIKSISEKDKGIYDAMNKGIELAKGEWLYFLGSDDTLYSTDTLEKVFDHTKASNADVFYGNIFSDRFGGVYAGEFDHAKLLAQNICHQSIFFKKSVFYKTGFFDLRFNMHADYDHNFKWFLSNEITHQFVDVIVANYADGGLSSQLGDYSFLKIKAWKYWYLRRREMSFAERVKLWLTELRTAHNEKRRADFYFICSRSFSFLLGV